MMILIKVADISNEVRPQEVAEPWLECLLQEFFNQVLQFNTSLYLGPITNAHLHGNSTYLHASLNSHLVYLLSLSIYIYI